MTQSNKPTLDEILKPIYNYGWPGTGMPGSQRQMTQEEAKQQLAQLIADIIGEDRDYKEYEPCPRCGAQYQYKCSCDHAEEVLQAEQRQRAKDFGVEL